MLVTGSWDKTQIDTGCVGGMGELKNVDGSWCTFGGGGGSRLTMRLRVRRRARDLGGEEGKQSDFKLLASVAAGGADEAVRSAECFAGSSSRNNARHDLPLQPNTEHLCVQLSPLIGGDWENGGDQEKSRGPGD